MVLALVLLPAVVWGQSSATGRRRTAPAPTYTVTVQSTVNGAEVSIDGQGYQGTTPRQVTLEAGTYTFRVTAPGHHEWVSSISINRDQTVTATLVPQNARVYLDIPSDILDAQLRNPESQLRVYVDGQLAEGLVINVPSGQRLIELRSGGMSARLRARFEPGSEYTIRPYYFLRTDG